MKALNLKLEFQINNSLSKKEASKSIPTTISFLTNTSSNTNQLETDPTEDYLKYYFNSANVKMEFFFNF